MLLYRARQWPRTRSPERTNVNMTKKTRGENKGPARGAKKKLAIAKDVLRDLPPATEDGTNARGGVSGGAGTVVSGHSRNLNLSFSRSSIG
jgi:hypothetical protein